MYKNEERRKKCINCILYNIFSQQIERKKNMDIASPQCIKFKLHVHFVMRIIISISVKCLHRMFWKNVKWKKIEECLTYFMQNAAFVETTKVIEDRNGLYKGLWTSREISLDCFTHSINQWS